ncbi:MAG: hypothetical protein ACPLRW_08895 [Moorellales bacterium]
MSSVFSSVSGWLTIHRAAGSGYREVPAALPPEAVSFRQEVERRARLDAGFRIWNGARWYLRSFRIAGRRLVLEFGPSDYWNFRATSANLDRPFWKNGQEVTLRRLYLDGRDLSAVPVAFLAHSFGLVLAVVTADGFLVFQRRSPEVWTRAGVLTLGVNEGLERPADADASGAPDFHRAARRGVYEELGPLAGEALRRLEFFSFGVDLEGYQHVLLGVVELNLILEELLASRISAPDAWEGELVAVPLDRASFARFVCEHTIWAPAALACAEEALLALLGPAISGLRGIPG